MQCWVEVMNKIECWLLLKVVDRHSLEWKWGGETVWMVYVLAYLEFPFGQWTCWSPKISPEGYFLEGWVAKGALPSWDDSKGLSEDTDFISVRGAIWDKFQETVFMVFAGGVVSPDSS
ncbi:hypothetical protein SERLA73DRAFT_68705 [Serpula lacrymans var. lacrymans S7.3]|uniref:Uncharacterized protein n=2 Tax=Serpula lacrymans var. lacrymans TaxID=341189 RepID=F8PHW7_SERL3|nr:hypothetical protein SERLA73DRAFT_68705 [Serpula lacrymans var. lacrymans S7.3]